MYPQMQPGAPMGGAPVQVSQIQSTVPPLLDANGNPIPVPQGQAQPGTTTTTTTYIIYLGFFYQ